MELFPAQPDLSLQISPPSSKPTSGWGRTPEEGVDLSFWKRALDSTNSIPSMPKPNTTCFDLSLSNPGSSDQPNSNHFNQNHYQLQNHHHQQEQLQGLSPELGFLRPIRGIPVYQNPPPPFRHPFAHQQSIDTPSLSSTTASSSTITTTPTPSPFHTQGLMRSRFLSRFPAKRSMRAPRMRCT